LIDVAVAVIQRSDGQVLLTQRQGEQDFAGSWEFPGGKFEANESVEQALARELQEELTITPTASAHLITIPWRYGHKAVRLHVWRVTQWQGDPVPQQGQPMRWVDVSDLSAFDFPPANKGIITALTLTQAYSITGAFADTDELIARVKGALSLGAGIIQFRAKLPIADYVTAAQAILPVVQAAGAKLLLNAPVDVWQQMRSAGLHLSSDKLWALCERPVPKDVLFTASVHNVEQMEQAQLLGVDALLVSPVLPTQSHPDEPALGWQAAAELVARATVPVYALGGVGLSELPQALACGFQGVAGIGSFWKKPIA
jgi:8-oxo-dGTP diphosphatase